MVYNLLKKSQSLSGPVPWGYDLHRYFSSGIVFFPCLLLPFLAAVLLICFLEALTPVDSASPTYVRQKLKGAPVGRRNLG